MNELKKAIETYLKDTKDPYNNFNLGLEYYRIGQTASSVSYFLRCAEKTNDKNLQYTCLLMNALCFEQQGNRIASTKGLYYQAISLVPERPEAYFLISRLNERIKEYLEGYMYACIALSNCNFDLPNLPINVEYPGILGLIFYRGVCEWHIGLSEQSRKTNYTLYLENKMDKVYYDLLKYNINTIGYPQYVLHYNKDNYQYYKFKFPGFAAIEKNYAQTYQDLFVLSALNGKTNGFYLEIGCNDPYYNNNTKLLEEFKWKGISIDIDQESIERFKDQRSNIAICSNALDINYSDLLEQNSAPKDIDYLQIDCDPPNISFEILTKIPFDEYRFATITFEHDYYWYPEIRELSRNYLRDRGYHLLVNDAAFTENNSYEDWWVHPDLIDINIIEKMTTNNQINYVKNYMLNLPKE